jgi:transcriptional regulator with XRE-family HTH domain
MKRSVLAVPPMKEGAMPAPTSHVALPMLRAWRVHRGLTQAELREKAGVAKITVSRAESGGKVNLLSARKLALALDTSIHELQGVQPDEWFRDYDRPAPRGPTGGAS